MTVFLFDQQDSQRVASLLAQSLALSDCPKSLLQWAASNAPALALLTEDDRNTVRAAYRAKRDELTGARQ